MTKRESPLVAARGKRVPEIMEPEVIELGTAAQALPCLLKTYQVGARLFARANVVVAPDPRRVPQYLTSGSAQRK
jgi:hypothetical protein